MYVVVTTVVVLRDLGGGRCEDVLQHFVNVELFQM